MTRITIVAVLLTALLGCSAPPQVVQDALSHQLEDFALMEAQLVPLVPADATVTYTTLAGDEKTRPAREVWSERMRAFMIRGAGLLAWSRGEKFDPAAAFAKLFPEKVSD
jgi:hypothetical protein